MPPHSKQALSREGGGGGGGGGGGWSGPTLSAVGHRTRVQRDQKLSFHPILCGSRDRPAAADTLSGLTILPYLISSCPCECDWCPFSRYNVSPLVFHILRIAGDSHWKAR